MAQIISWHYKDQILYFSATDDPHQLKQNYISLLVREILRFQYLGQGSRYAPKAKAPRALFNALKHLDHYNEQSLRAFLQIHLNFKLVEHCHHNDKNILVTKYNQTLNNIKGTQMNPKDSNTVTVLTPISKKDIIKDAISQLFISKLDDGEYITEAQQEILEELIDSVN